MKLFTPVLVFGLVVSCTLVEPESQSNLVSRTYMVPGPLDSIDFSISFFDEDVGTEISVPEFIGEVMIFNENNSGSFPLKYHEGNSFQIDNSSVNISAGDSVVLVGSWKKYQLMAKTVIPARPENIKLIPIIFKLNIATEGEKLDLVWEQESQVFLIAKIQSEDPLFPFPDSYKDSWQDERVFLSNQKPENDGIIVINPWDFEGTGLHKVMIYWFDETVPDLYNNPIQSGIFSPGHGIIEGLGFLHSFDSDTFFVQVSF